jgi:hypothetical protein
MNDDYARELTVGGRASEVRFAAITGVTDERHGFIEDRKIGYGFLALSGLRPVSGKVSYKEPADCPAGHALTGRLLAGC